jgi:hypothetical protein
LANNLEGPHSPSSFAHRLRQKILVGVATAAVALGGLSLLFLGVVVVVVGLRFLDEWMALTSVDKRDMRDFRTAHQQCWLGIAQGLSREGSACPNITDMERILAAKGWCPK